jgi:nitrogen PTS system EIIA component
MPHSYFNVDTLAAHLHLTPQQVSRLADRGKLPGRKVAGEWRFPRPEIHSWLEERIGLADEDDLVEVEGVLKRNAPADQKEEVSLAAMLPQEAIAVPLLARTRNSVINAMVELAASTGILWDPRAMAEAVKAREEMHPTALEGGVALMHPRRPMAKILSQPMLALGRTSHGIPFGAGAPMTDVFFLICSMDDRGHLRVLARLSRLLNVTDFLARLRAVDHAAEARQLIVDAEEEL